MTLLTPNGVNPNINAQAQQPWRIQRHMVTLAISVLVVLIGTAAMLVWLLYRVRYAATAQSTPLPVWVEVPSADDTLLPPAFTGNPYDDNQLARYADYVSARAWSPADDMSGNWVIVLFANSEDAAEHTQHIARHWLSTPSDGWRLAILSAPPLPPALACASQIQAWPQHLSLTDAPPPWATPAASQRPTGTASATVLPAPTPAELSQCDPAIVSQWEDRYAYLLRRYRIVALPVVLVQKNNTMHIYYGLPEDIIALRNTVP